MTTTSYDVSIIEVEGTYTVEVTAIGDNYYNSETTIVEFIITEEPIITPNPGNSCRGLGIGLGVAGGCLSIAAAGILFLMIKKGKKTHAVL